MPIIPDSNDHAAASTAGSQIIDYGDTYGGDLRQNIVGGRGNYNTINVVNHNDRSTLGAKGFDILSKHISKNALHNSGEVSEQPKCHPGTRVAILDHLSTWACLLTSPYPIQWLHGPAGAGKSSILRTIAQRLFEGGLLIGSFFFFRTSPGRNTSENVIATIAYQLALAIPETRQHIGEAVERNPIIFSLSLWDQALALIISPLVSVFYAPQFHSRKYPRIIIIDGLDECREQDKQSYLLRVLRGIIQFVPLPLAVLVASRPEHHIRGAFDLRTMNECSSRLGLDDSYEPDADIRRYLVDKFNDIRQSRPMEFPSDMEWPSPVAIEELVAKASGQFIYISTVDKFVSSPRHNPIKRLNVVLGAVSAGKQKPFEQLDSLYSTIFETIEEAYVTSALRVLGFLLIPRLNLPKHRYGYESHSPAYLEHFLEFERGDVRQFLFDLESLLTIRANRINIQFFHASLSDYLFDKSRSGQFWIDSGLIYADIVQHSIAHLLTWPGKHPLTWLASVQRWLTFPAEVGVFFVEYNQLLSSNTGSTLELRQAIEQCDFDKVIATLTKTNANGMKDICPVILDIAMHESRFENADKIFLPKILRFRQIILERIPIYFSNIRLKSFLVCVCLAYAEGAPAVIGQFMNDLAEFLLSPTDRRVEQNKGFNLLENTRMPPLIAYVKPFLNDTEGNYFVDEVEYTNITLLLIQGMSRADRPNGLEYLASGLNPARNYVSNLSSNLMSSSDNQNKPENRPQSESSPMLRSYIVNRISPYLFSHSTVRSDLVEETKMILENPRARFGPNSEFLSSMEAYVSRAGAESTSTSNSISVGPLDGVIEMIKAFWR